MTNKEMIIDDVNVAGCEFGINSIGFICGLKNGKTDKCDCYYYPNCYYKQLQREKQTSQEARDTAIKEFNRAETLNTLLQRLQAENDRYKQVLEEVRKVAKGLAQTKIPFCQIEEQIQEIINEVLNNEL